MVSEVVFDAGRRDSTEAIIMKELKDHLLESAGFTAAPDSNKTFPIVYKITLTVEAQ